MDDVSFAFFKSGEARRTQELVYLDVADRWPKGRRYR
jgi:hypothetical protein